MSAGGGARYKAPQAERRRLESRSSAGPTTSNSALPDHRKLHSVSGFPK